MTARDHLKECEDEELAAREAVAYAHGRHEKAQATLSEARRQLASFVEAVCSDVFSPSLAAKLCRALREPDDHPD